ncbi:MAG: DUF2892 domain-containing protein [Paludibacteraceae bacterium]
MKYKSNVGTADRIIRLLLAMTLIILFYLGILPNIFGIIVLILALLLVATCLISYCPIYKLMNVSSIFKKKREN